MRQSPILSAFLLALVLFQLGCEGGRDQTAQANRLVDEMNAVIERGEATTKQAVAREEEIQSKDIEEERAAVKAIAQQQAGLYAQSAAAFREAADKAEKAARLRIEEWFRGYLDLKARQLRKSAEILEVGRERAQVLAGDQSIEEMDDKLTVMAEQIAKLSQEEDALIKQVQKIEEERKADFRQDGNQNGNAK